jgi:spore maturation protein CgeB
MKILYIYRDYKGRRKLYGDMMTKCGQNVSYMKIIEKKIPNQVKIKDIKKYNPDIVWLYTPYYLWYKVVPDETVDYLKSKNIKLISYCHLIPDLSLEKQSKIYSKLDFLFVHCKEADIFFKTTGINSFYSPLGFYPHQYFKTISKYKKYDVSFMGSAFKNLPIDKDKRTLYLEALRKYNIGIFGEGFKGRLKNVKIDKYRGHDIQRKIYSQTKINLGLPFSLSSLEEYKNKCYFKNRFFEIPATCNFFLTIRHPDFLDIFDEDTIGYYDNNIESLKESVNRYLKDKDIRKRMAKKAYKLVHEKHTFLHRFKEMFRIIK